MLIIPQYLKNTDCRGWTPKQWDQNIPGRTWKWAVQLDPQVILMINQGCLVPEIIHRRSGTPTGKRPKAKSPSLSLPIQPWRETQLLKNCWELPPTAGAGRESLGSRSWGTQEETFRRAANKLRTQSTPALGSVSWLETGGLSSDSYKNSAFLFKKRNYKDVENMEPAYIAGRNVKWYRLLWSSLAVPQRVKHRLTL